MTLLLTGVFGMLAVCFLSVFSYFSPLASEFAFNKSVAFPPLDTFQLVWIFWRAMLMRGACSPGLTRSAPNWGFASSVCYPAVQLIMLNMIFPFPLWFIWSLSLQSFLALWPANQMFSSLFLLCIWSLPMRRVFELSFVEFHPKTVFFPVFFFFFFEGCVCFLWIANNWSFSPVLQNTCDMFCFLAFLSCRCPFYSFI